MSTLSRCVVVLALVTSFFVASVGPTMSPALADTACAGPVGRRLPVLLVHGFNSSANTWKPAVRQRFCTSRTYSDVFDYGPRSNEWVTDDAIGPALAGKILALANASRRGGGQGKVIVVAHSMGGLAVRCAASALCNGGVPGVADRLAGVVTFGTPNEGTFWRGKGGALAVGGLGGILSGICYALEVDNLGQNDLLSRICHFPRTVFTSHASRGFTPDSSALKALPGTPGSTVPVLALAGQARVRTGIFFAGVTLGPSADTGDLIVGVHSAHAVSRRVDGVGGQRTIDCGSLSLGVKLGAATPVSGGTHLLCSHLNETSYLPFLDAASRMVDTWMAKHPLPRRRTPVTASPTPRATPTHSTTTSFAPGSHFQARCVVAWPTAPEYTSTAITMRMSCLGVPQHDYLFTDVQLNDPHFEVTPSTGQMEVTGTVVDSATSGLGFRTLQVLASSIQK